MKNKGALLSLLVCLIFAFSSKSYCTAHTIDASVNKGSLRESNPTPSQELTKSTGFELTGIIQPVQSIFESTVPAFHSIKNNKKSVSLFRIVAIYSNCPFGSHSTIQGKALSFSNFPLFIAFRSLLI